jgi:hypothetical protein
VRHFMANCVGKIPAPDDGAKARWHASGFGKPGGVKPISQRDTSRPREEKALSLESHAYTASPCDKRRNLRVGTVIHDRRKTGCARLSQKAKGGHGVRTRSMIVTNSLGV